MRMYAIVARESLLKMNGNRGKLSAQTGHAFLHAWWDSLNKVDDRIVQRAMAYKNSGSAKKITLICETVEELRQLCAAYHNICGTSLVRDAGLTCFKEPTTTCLGIGPIRDEDIGDDLKALKVLI